MIQRSVIIDFSKKCGKIKPLNSLTRGPLFNTPVPIDLGSTYRELGVSIVRTGGYECADTDALGLDVSRIFPAPMLDERFPESYDFDFADRYMKSVKDSGAVIYLRLGESLDRYSYNSTRPHLNPEKWARVAEKIIRHYNNAWGGGLRLGIKYVEIFPGADRMPVFLKNPKLYYEFYRIVSSHLKEAFPTLRIGAYSMGGFASLNHYNAGSEQKRYITFLEGFLAYISSKTTHAPLDFLSWQCSPESAEELVIHSNYARSYLSQYGFKKCLSIVSELAPVSDNPKLSRSYPSLLAASLINAQNAFIDMIFYKDAHPYSPSNALFTVDDGISVHRYASFGVYSSFGRLLSLGSEAYTSDNFRKEIYTLGAVGRGGGALLVATENFSGSLVITPTGAAIKSYSIKGMIGGGPRGGGFSTEETDIPYEGGSITVKVGRNEIYLFSFELCE